MYHRAPNEIKGKSYFKLEVNYFFYKKSLLIYMNTFNPTLNSFIYLKEIDRVFMVEARLLNMKIT
jgi:hypothetical protein